MERRGVLTLMGATAALGTGTLIGSAVAQQTIDPLRVIPNGARRQTGRIDLIISGQRASPLKSGNDILQTARATEFFEAGRHKVELGGGSVEYAPARFPQNALAVAVIQGLLVHKFTITDTPSNQWSFLSAGTFYCYIDFVEGPDFDGGRWIARIVDEAGEVRRLIPGVEVRQIIDLNIDEQQRQEHSKPSIHTHGLAFGEEENQLMAESDLRVLPRSSVWTVTSGDWQAAGSGCARLQTCTPVAQ